MPLLPVPSFLRDYAERYGLTWTLTCESAEGCGGFAIEPHPKERRFHLRALPRCFASPWDSRMIWSTILPRLHFGETRDPVFSDHADRQLHAFWIEMLLDVWSVDVFCAFEPTVAETFLPLWRHHVLQYQLPELSSSRDQLDRLARAVETIRELAILKRLGQRFGRHALATKKLTDILAYVQQLTAARGSMKKLYDRWCGLPPIAEEKTAALRQFDQAVNDLFRMLFIPIKATLVWSENRHAWQFDPMVPDN